MTCQKCGRSFEVAATTEAAPDLCEFCGVEASRRDQDARALAGSPYNPSWLREVSCVELWRGWGEL
jgi:hypothetical protein